MINSNLCVAYCGLFALIGSCLVEVTGLVRSWLENTKIGTTFTLHLTEVGEKVRSEAFNHENALYFYRLSIHPEFRHVYLANKPRS